MEQNLKMKVIWAKTRKRFDPLLVLLHEKIQPSHIFFTLSVFIFAGLGVYLLMRAVTDDYAPVSINFIHLFLTSLLWLVILSIFGILTLKLHSETPLSNQSTVLFVLAVLEIAFLAFQTNKTFTYIPRSHMIDEQKNVEAMMNNLHKTLPVKINEDITEQSAFLKGKILVLEYVVKNMEAHNWTNDILRPQMLPQACDYLTRYSKYNTIKAVFYAFGGDAKSFNIAIRPDDCAPHATSAAPADSDAATDPGHGQ